ncbi:MAG: RDD family protein, partial [Mycobacterium sp.]
AYAAWHTRALALLIDYLPAAVISVGVGSAFGDSGSGQAAGLLVNLIVVAYLVWNYGYRQGTTGSSLGKSVMKIQVLSEATGRPVGFGMSIVRQLAHLIDGLLFYIGYLFPLWDAKRQTLADKIMTTVVLPIPAG